MADPRMRQQLGVSGLEQMQSVIMTFSCVLMHSAAPDAPLCVWVFNLHLVPG